MARIGTVIGRSRGSWVYPDTRNADIARVRAQAYAIRDKVAGVLENWKQATPEIIKMALDPIMDLSQQYCPIGRTRRLYNSAFYEDRVRSDRHIEVVFGYAKGGNPPYAGIVHERTWVRHAEGKGAKFLERAVDERLHIFNKILKEQYEVKAKVGSRGKVR